LVQKHSDLESRSLLQAYTDDLRFCELIKAKHERMKSMRSAQQIKDDFSSFCFTVAKRFKMDVKRMSRNMQEEVKEYGKKP
jgi:hypothetical protein